MINIGRKMIGDVDDMQKCPFILNKINTHGSARGPLFPPAPTFFN